MSMKMSSSVGSVEFDAGHRGRTGDGATACEGRCPRRASPRKTPVHDLDARDACRRRDGLRIEPVADPGHRLEPDGVGRVAVADVADRVVEDLLPVVDHDDVVAELLGLDHDVRREDDRGALLVLLADQVAEQPHVDRVEPAEGLVEDQQVRLVEHGRDELDLLLHALAEFLAALVPDAGEFDFLEPRGDLVVESRGDTPLSRPMWRRNCPTFIFL
jgi:hypothetical protein